MGLPPEVDKGIDIMQKMILTARILHSTIIYLESTTPFGIILGLISIGSAAAAASSVVYDFQRGK
jgi:hypothetical protein